MAELVIYGSPNSTYVRTARLACEEKGVPYDLEGVGQNTVADLKTPAYMKLHP